MPDQENKSLTLTIVGAGNLAWHLAHVFTEKGLKINKIINRSIEPARQLAAEIGTECTTDFGVSNRESDFTILAINDSNLGKILERMDVSGTIMIHTSGSTDMRIFEGKAERFGILYPVQSFTKNSRIDFSTIPLCIEASDESTVSRIFFLASTISKYIQIMDSAKRRILHLAAVMANNFTNHLIARTFDLLENNNIDKKILFPLIEGTFNKVMFIGPKEAQTGPAKRNNIEIMKRHLAILEKEPALKIIYNAISESIVEYYSQNS